MPSEPEAGGADTRDASAEQATGPSEARPDPAAVVRPETVVPWQPIRLEETDSTNRYLVDLARSGAPHGTVVLAERQSAGRGRLGRRWLDAGGASVLCSVVFRWTLAMEQWYLGGWIVALSAADAAGAVASVRPTCKWPNDLVVGGRKVAGVLGEVAEPPLEGRPGALVVGIGINCNWPTGWPPASDPDAAAISATATSLDREAGRPVDRDAVAAALVAGIARRSAALAAAVGAQGGVGAHGGEAPQGGLATHGGLAPHGGVAPQGGVAAGMGEPVAALAGEYRARCSTIGSEVVVEVAGERFGGRALDVDDRGHLLVDVGSCIRTVAAGDVVHVR